MTGSVELPVAVSETDGESVLPSAVADRLGLGNGDAVTLQFGVDREVVTAVRAESGGTERVVIPPAVADRLDVESGQRVRVVVADPAVADSLRLAPVPRLSVRGGETLLREAIGDRPVTTGGTVPVSLFDGSLDVPFEVLSTEPTGPVRVGERTEVRIEDGPAPVGRDETTTPLPASAVGGYDQVVDALETALRAVLAGSGDTTEAGARRAGILLAGPHGVGKTHLLRHAVWSTGASLHRVSPQRLLSADGAAATEYLSSVATAARGSERGVVYLDRLDAVVEAVPPATTAAVREWVDQVRTATGLAVVAEVTDPAAVPTDLRQGARLSRTLTVPEPDRSDRAAILSTLAAGATDADVSSVGRRAFGYVAADLVALWLTAVELAVERSDTDRPTVSAAQLERALERTEPSGLDGTTTEVPTTTFDDVGGLDGPKRELTRAVEWPLRNPELFEELAIEPPSGVLLYGPPGTGKTMLARAVASTSDANFTAVDGPELMDRYVGESERAVRRVFERARSNAPTVLFFDEIDALGSARTEREGSGAANRVVSQLLTELDGVERRGRVTVLAATNEPRRLDDALLRPGRFDRVVEVPMPDAAARAEIFRIHLRGRTASGFDVDVRTLAERTDGYTGSDIAAVVREAGLFAIETRVTRAEGHDSVGDDKELRIGRQHLKRALESVGPSLSSEARARYESFERFD
jgi:transitional endoplasmic reticulum ATPase